MIAIFIFLLAWFSGFAVAGIVIGIRAGRGTSQTESEPEPPAWYDDAAGILRDVLGQIKERREAHQDRVAVVGLQECLRRIMDGEDVPAGVVVLGLRRLGYDYEAGLISEWAGV